MSEPLALMLGKDDYRALVPHPALDCNKYSRGTVGVVGGSAPYPGAPILAAKAAARCGAGYVRLVTAQGCESAARAHLLSIPVSACASDGEGALCEASLGQAHAALAKSDVILIGPGMGTSAGAVGFLTGFAQNRPMVFDADALNIIATHHELLATPAQHPRIITPHEGEAARLLGRAVSDRNHDALELSRTFDCVTVLKGPQTLVATPAGELRMVAQGGPELAKAGTGDVLGGMIAAFLAQGLDAFDAATLGVYVHGSAGKRAARELSVYAVMPEDIISEIGPTLLDLNAKDNS